MKLAICVILVVAIGSKGSRNRCTSIHHGRCINYKRTKCAAGYQSRLCPGSSDIKCCLPCHSSCQSANNGYSDWRCSAADGECWVNNNYCSGNYVTGKCGGPSNRQCCVPSTNQDCQLVQYNTVGTVFQGYQRLKIWIDLGFRTSMDKIDGYAKECDVDEVLVTNAFRKAKQKLSGTVVTPAKKSNHLVGHAIDMNVRSNSGFCNKHCLLAKRNPEARCFVNKIIADHTLRWGGTFSNRDSVHIDDNYYYRSPSAWNTLYYKLQKPCENIDN